MPFFGRRSQYKIIGITLHNEELSGQVRRRGTLANQGYGRTIKDGGRYLKLAYRPVGHDVVEVVREGAGATCGSDREIAVYIERHAAGGLTRQVIDGGHIQSKHVHNLYTGGKPRGAGVGLVTA